MKTIELIQAGSNLLRKKNIKTYILDSEIIAFKNIK